MMDGITILLVLVSIFCIVSTIFIAFMLHRNQKTYEYFMKVLESAHAEGLELLRSDTWTEDNDPYNALDEIDYNKVVNTFWRPIDSFFPEKYRGL